MVEIDPLIRSFSHLAEFARAAEALHTLQKVASLVKPIMRARGWKVKQLVEFYPNEQNLLGLNVNRGQKICLRLRYPGDRNQFLPMEQVVDTMLHELAHNVFGPHDGKFHALWNQLRDEHESLIMKGYTGEGFLSEGHRLGGRRIPMEEARRLARASAESRRTLNAGSGQRLGGGPARPGQDIRKVIADAASRRNRTLQGCANDNQSENEIFQIAETATQNGFKTQAEEDAANDAAIAQALWELVEEEERAKKGDVYLPPRPVDRGSTSTWDSRGQSNVEGKRRPEATPLSQRSREIGDTWTCNICTLVNPAQYLCCDACGTERTDDQGPGPGVGSSRSERQSQTVIDLTGPETPGGARKPRATTTSRSGTKKSATHQPTVATAPQAPKTWVCHGCGSTVDHRWWSCVVCGTIKLAS